MRSRVARWVVVLVALIGMGGHWHVLQLYAWVSMVQDSAPEKGLGTSVMEVMSGEAPCELCLAIREAQQDSSQPKAPVPPEPAKLDKFFQVHRAIVLRPMATHLQIAQDFRQRGFCWWDDVPAPPPRVA